MQKPIMCTPCSVCEKFYIGPKGEKRGERHEGDAPRCQICPKVKFGEDVGDEKVMRAILLAGSGLPEYDYAIRKDSWVYSAVRLIRGYEQDKQVRQVESQTRNNKWQR